MLLSETRASFTSLFLPLAFAFLITIRPTEPDSNELIINNVSQEDSLFECYPNFASDEVFVRCQWTGEPCVISFDFQDTENQRTYKMRRTLTKGTQTLKFDVRNFSPGPYYIFVGNDNWNKVLDASFVKVKNNK